MDFDSPDKSLEETSKEEGAPYVRELDLTLLDNKDEKFQKIFQTEALDDNVQGYSNQQHAGSPLLPGNRAVLSSSDKAEEFCSPTESDMQHDGMERKISDHTDEGLRSTIKDYESHNKMRGSNFVGLSGEQLDMSADRSSNELEPQNSDPCFSKPVLSAGNNDNSYEVVDNGLHDHQSAKSPSFVATENGDAGNILGNSPSGKAELANEEMDHEYFNHDSKADYPVEAAASDNGGMVRECTGLHSLPKMQNGTPSPERNMSDPMESSPHNQPSARKEPLPPENNDRKSAPPSPFRRRRSPSPEKHVVGQKRASSCDRLSPPVRRKSPSGRTAHRDSHCRDNSPKKCLSASPQREDSSRKRDRSASRSPVRRDSSGSGRDHNGRSRSRPPYARDCYQRSPRRRHSSRRRSPPPSYYYHRRFPRWPWSPPRNRSTGIGRPGRNLFVAGFSHVTTERDLEKKFSRFGHVTDVRIVRHKRSGDSRGFGFLSLERDEDADAAIHALNQTEWNGRIVLVEKSKTCAH